MMRSTKSILNPAFVYRDSANTSVALTIKREQKRLKAEAAAKLEQAEAAAKLAAADEAERLAKVKHIAKRGAK